MIENALEKMLEGTGISKAEFDNIREELESVETSFSVYNREYLMSLIDLSVQILNNSAAPHNWGTINIWIPFDREFLGFDQTDFDDLEHEKLYNLVRKLFAFIDRAAITVPQAGKEFIAFFGEEAQREGIGCPDQFDFMTYEDFYKTTNAIDGIMDAFKDGCDKDELYKKVEREVLKQGDAWGLILTEGLWMDEEVSQFYKIPKDLVAIGVDVNDYSFWGLASPAYVIFKENSEDGLMYPYHSFVDIAG